MTTNADSVKVTGGPAAQLLCPFDLTVDQVAALLNAEFADHPVYDGFELQWFDDTSHGCGMLAFLSRRADRRVDYYVDPSLNLDRSGYAIGGGTGRWVETDFDVARLEVGRDGVVAEVQFTDVDGRRIEVMVDDRGAGPRRPAELLAPVGSGIDEPISLLLVYLHGFDLLRRSDQQPQIRIDGQQVSTGTLPGRLLHRRHLIKAAAPLTLATVCRARSGPLAPVEPDDGGVHVDDSGTGITRLEAHHDQAQAVLTFDPPFPPLGQLEEARPEAGAWQVTVDGAPITGGRWHAVRRAQRVEVSLEVTRRWEPSRGMPMLISVVSRVVPVFRRWPTTYRWTAEVDLGSVPATITSRWERTGRERGGSYRRATGT